MIDVMAHSDLDKKLLEQVGGSAPDLTDDHYDYSKVIVIKPWGYEYLIYQNDTVAVWVLYLKKNAQTSMHCHPSKKTSLIVLEGEVECSSADQTLKRNVADGILIEKGAFHQTKALSERGAFVMEIETPINKRDLIRLKDLYGREHLGYENSDQHSKNTQNYNYLSLDAISENQIPKKRFGNCSITFRRIVADSVMNELKNFVDDDVVSVIRGKLFDPATKQSLTVGDTHSVKELRKKGKLTAFGDAEILIVKRVDTDIKVSDFISQFLKRSGIRTVFVVPGDANVHLLDSLGREEGVDCIAFQSEGGASLSIEGFSKSSQQPGVLVLSSGASGPHALAGVSNAWVDSTPLLVISGQARSDQCVDSRLRQFGNKALNIIDIVKPITKYAVQITDPLSVEHHISKALHLATQGRSGPVWIDIPIDILGMTVDQKDLVSYEVEKVSRPAKLDAKIKEVITLLKESKRPVILAGNGIRLAGATDSFLTLIEKLNIPVLTSRRGADLVAESHPLFVGRPGSFGQRRANFIVQNADCILGIGTRFSIPFIGRNTNAFGRNAKKIVVDIDGNELLKSTLSIDIPVECSADQFIDALLAQSPQLPKYDEWWRHCAEWKKNFAPLEEGYSHGESINPYLVINDISRKLKDDEIIVIDGGAVMHRSMQIFEFGARQRLVSSTGLDLAGFAIPGAVGAAEANRGKRIVCVCEDRGFQTGIPELQTIIDNKLPIIIFILKSQGQSVVRKIQKDFFGGRYVGTDNSILFGSPNFLNIAAAYGFAVTEISHPSKINCQLEEVLKGVGPSICVVHTDGEQELIPRTGFITKEDGKWLAKPLEDMYPFLDRDLLKRNMLIELLEEN